VARLEVREDEQPGHRGDGTRCSGLRGLPAAVLSSDAEPRMLPSTSGLMPLSCGQALSRSWEEEGSKNLRRGSGCEDSRQ